MRERGWSIELDGDCCGIIYLFFGWQTITRLHSFIERCVFLIDN